MALTLLGALVIAVHPESNALDRWGFAVDGSDTHSAVLGHIADLSTLQFVVAGSLLAALVVVRRDRWRAVACLAGPILAAALVDWVLKPVVGRHFEGVLSFPSGTVTVVAALATSWAVAVPTRFRWPVIVVGSLLVASVSWAVVGLRWHYPSDVAVGWVVGVGTVLLVDGVLHQWLPPAPSRDDAKPSGRT